MKPKKIISAFLAFVLPWIIFVIGIAKPVHNAWLYVGSVTWFLTALFIALSFYKF